MRVLREVVSCESLIVRHTATIRTSLPTYHHNLKQIFKLDTGHQTIQITILVMMTIRVGHIDDNDDENDEPSCTRKKLTKFNSYLVSRLIACFHPILQNQNLEMINPRKDSSISVIPQLWRTLLQFEAAQELVESFAQEMLTLHCPTNGAL